ncbi:hypothetical protein K456DRAFT_745022 [Colletotrichum gloeosporioides 23]|nr:hypothetical protein K456DRAFT_745022 [Colletotrichum gloeosporioides 23]
MGNDIIVDKDSALLRMTNEIPLPVQGANHREICKFDSAESQKYKPVRRALEEMIPESAGAYIIRLKGQAAAYLKQVGDGDKGFYQLPEPRSALQMRELEWITRMNEAKSWQTSQSFGLLYVEYDTSPQWQDDVSTILSRPMERDGFVTQYFNCSGDLKSGSKKAKKCLIPRLLTSIILRRSDDVIKDMNQAIAVMKPDELREQHYTNKSQIRLDESWDKVYCSESSPWQEQWILLSCALQCLRHRVVLILTGLEAEFYKDLDEGLKYLDPQTYFSTSKPDVEPIFRPIHHKVLIVGETRPRYPREDSEVNTSSVYSRVNAKAEVSACLSSLHFAELYARRDKVKKSDIEHGTTEWILEHPAYHDWLSNKSTLLWIFGKPGSGKSTLAATLRRPLMLDSHPPLLADFFYSARGGRAEIEHSFMLRSVLFQLLSQDSDLFPAYEAIFRRHSHQTTLDWGFEELEEVFLNLPHLALGASRTFFLILDGLDESQDSDDPIDSRERTLSLFSQLRCSGGQHTFRVVALSRPNLSIKRAIRPNLTIDMKNENTADIEVIVDTGILKLWRLMSEVGGGDQTDAIQMILSPVSQHQTRRSQAHHEMAKVREYLLERADGVILWVVMVLRELFAVAKSAIRCTPADMENVLADIPTSLEELYQDMFVKIIDKSFKNNLLAGYVFSWLIFADKTLKVCEIRDALAMFGWSKESLHEDNYLNSHRLIQIGSNWERVKWALNEACGGLVEIVPNEKPAISKLLNERTVGPDDFVQIIHQTAKDFIVFNGSSLSRSISNGQGLDDVLAACYHYLELAFNEMHDTSANKSLAHFVRHLDDRPLLEYALGTFPEVLNKRISEGGEFAKSLQEKIILNLKHLDRWSSVAWWFFRSWIERVVPHLHLECQDRSFEQLRETMNHGQHHPPLLAYIIRIAFLCARINDPDAESGDVDFDLGDTSFPDLSSKGTQSHMWPIILTADSETVPSKAFTSDSGWVGYAREYGFINPSLVACGLTLARRINASTATRVLGAATVHKSNPNNAEFNFVIEDISYGSARGQLETPWGASNSRPETRLVQVMDVLRDLEEGALASLMA